MSLRAHEGGVYAPRRPTDDRLASSRLPIEGPPQSSLSASQILPPMTQGGPSPSVNHDNYDSARMLSLHGSLTNSPSDSTIQAASFPIYAPTANTYYNIPNPITTSPTNTIQNTSLSYPHSTDALQPNVYMPATTSHHQIQDQRPMHSTSNGHVNRSLSFASKRRTPTDTKMGDVPQQTHVVGSQGRRGILPSAEGRPKADPGSAIVSKGSLALARTADGKFSCQYCHKHYLHAKHLKRHMLRHTGVRPYSCGLCADTFSRSDILKRHFMKCSARRGNPTGEGHLAHSRANKKNRANGEEIAAGINSMTTEQMARYPPAPFSPTTLESPISMPALDVDQQTYSERPQSIARHLSHPNDSKKKKLTIQPPHSTRGSLGSVYDSSAYSTGHVTPDSVTTSGVATPYGYPLEARSTPLSPDAPFNHSLGLNGVGRGPTSSHYHNNSLPQIVGHPNGRGQDPEWPPFNAYSNEDFTNGHSYPDTGGSHQYIKDEHDFHSHWGDPSTYFTAKQ